MVRRLGTGLLLVAIGFALLPEAAWGQARRLGGPRIGDGILAGTYEPWSLLAPLADLPLGFPAAAVRLPGLLEGSAPRVGLFWNGANPGALPFEVDESRSDFAVAWELTPGAHQIEVIADPEERVIEAARARENNRLQLKLVVP